MLVFQEYHDKTAPPDKTSSGISYKDKIAQLKAQRRHGNQ
jgi:hypothetical protein